MKEKLIVALDVESEKKAKEFVDLLYPTIKLFKVGSALVLYCESLIRYIKDKGGSVFLDLKWYDIPNTVYSAVASGTGAACALVSATTPNSIEQKLKPGVFMMTVHAQGSEDMLRRAAQGAEEKAQELNIEKPLIVGVTELTSESSDNVGSIVLDRARKAKNAGLDGVVCSVYEAAQVKKECGKDFIVVTPGIRPQGAAKDDQARVATAKYAIKAGADYIVIGRPILEAKSPKLAAQEIIKEIQ